MRDERPDALVPISRALGLSIARHWVSNTWAIRTTPLRRRRPIAQQKELLAAGAWDRNDETAKRIVRVEVEPISSAKTRPPRCAGDGRKPSAGREVLRQNFSLGAVAAVDKKWTLGADNSVGSIDRIRWMASNDKALAVAGKARSA
jgi:hypothetical protein